MQRTAGTQFGGAGVCPCTRRAPSDPPPRRLGVEAPTGLYADNSAEAESAVNRYADLGYIQIKLYSSLRPELVPGIAKLAHSRGLRVSGHIPNGMVASQFVEPGSVFYAAGRNACSEAGERAKRDLW